MPGGYVFVAREITLIPDQILNDASGNIIVPIINFFVNRVAVPQMSNLTIDISTGIPIPAFFIAQQYSIVDVQIIYDIGAMTPSPVLNITANIQGNFLLTNEPANLAVTNTKGALLQKIGS